MGCGLRKLKPVSEESSPGKIYSTLKRPQVETKVGVAYTYRYLDFLIGKDDGTSTLSLSSVRELPGQLHELYQQGFVLAAVHPFIHPCGPESNSPQHQLYRAILVRHNDGVERSQLTCPPPHRLHLEECLPADQVPTPELIQGYVKKQVQDAADQGVRFVGFVQEPYGAPCTRVREPETPSLSLHSSPSSVLGSLGSCSPPEPCSPGTPGTPAPRPGVILEEVPRSEGPEGPAGVRSDAEGEELTENTGTEAGSGVEAGPTDTSCSSPERSEEKEEEEEGKESLVQNNNRANAGDGPGWPRYTRYRRGDGVELLALFNHPPVREGPARYYTVKVPLKVQNRDEGVKGVEANWLDHMTQHFNNGASLVDGYFHLGGDNDLLPMSVESVFIFQEGSETEASAPPPPAYDAIVVEQWTVIDGLQVKADYVPLLQSLATYGWRLTCVLPTPVIKTKSDGSLSTKQIVFLQRPVLSRKKREAKKLIFKTRSKTGRKCTKEESLAKNKKKSRTTEEKDPEDPKMAAEDGEKEAEAWALAEQDGGEKEQERGRGEEEDGQTEEVKVSVEETGKGKEGGAEFQPERKAGGENGDDKAEEETRAEEEEQEDDKESPQESEEERRTEEPLENGALPSDADPDGRGAEEVREGAVEVVVVVNGFREPDEAEDADKQLCTKLPETATDAVIREPAAEAVPTNQSPDGAQ